MQLGFKDDHKVYHSIQYNSVDPYWLQLMKIEVVQGRLFSPGNTADKTTAAVVNEAFLKEFNLKYPVGKKLPGRFEQQIIGVVKDFNIESLHTKVKPMMLTISPDSVFRHTEDVSIMAPPQPRITIRVRPGRIAANINLLQQVWKDVAPNQDFDYKFLDESIAAQYEAEKRTNIIVKIASLLSIFMPVWVCWPRDVSRCPSYKGNWYTENTGSKNFTLVTLLAKDFIKLVSIAAGHRVSVGGVVYE